MAKVRDAQGHEFPLRITVRTFVAFEEQTGKSLFEPAVQNLVVGGRSFALVMRLAEELKITADQKKQIADLQQKQMESMREVFQGVDFRNMAEEERTKMMSKVQDMNKANGEKTLAVLTDAQKKHFKEMQGEAFKFPAMGPPRGGGRPPL